MTYLPPFPFTAAERRARDAGLAVLGCHYAVLPPGVPVRDGLGNYVQNTCVWIGPAELGRQGVGSVDAAYAYVVQSIHTIATPDIGTVLANIRRALLTVDEFPQRADYVEAMLPHHNGDPQTIADAWTWDLDCALRAKKALPAELVDWLISGKWRKW